MENIEQIKEFIEKCFSEKYPNWSDNKKTIHILNLFQEHLNSGAVRSATYTDKDVWVTNEWVKKGILLLFRYGTTVEMKLTSSDSDFRFSFFDKDATTLRQFTIEDEVRIVPGCYVRNGAHLSKKVICMSPSFINIGVSIDENTMIDSNVLVGTCAQIGKHCHISAGTQVGGVLEPLNANPVIIEDNVFVGGNSSIFEGVIIKKNAVISTGVSINASSKIYDIVNSKTIEKTENAPLTIPSNAVVVQGTRPILSSEWAKENQLSIATPLIIKYRDLSTDAKTELNTILR